MLISQLWDLSPLSRDAAMDGWFEEEGVHREYPHFYLKYRLCYTSRFTALNLGKQYDFDRFVLQFCNWRLMVGIQILEWSLLVAVF